MASVDLSKQTLGQRIKRLRQAHGSTLAALGDKVGVSRQNVQSWESGAWAPSLKKLIQLADHYDVSLDWLIGRRDDGRPRDEDQLLASYRAMPSKSRRLVLGLVQDYSASAGGPNP